MPDILLADEQGVIRTLVYESLTSLGHRVALARSGTEVITHCRKQSYDLIILDYRMPDMKAFSI
jgi:CheY-like chemotaxis protein